MNAALGPVLDHDRFDQMRAMLGAEAIARLLRKLAAEIAVALDDAKLDGDDRGALARDAHKMISAAGLLGFAGLSAACAAFERDHVRGAPTEPAIAALRRERDAASAAIAATLAELGPG